MKKLLKSQKGFTLIELLVVIAIIGILAAVVLVNLNTARERARNAQRISDIDQVKLALQLHFDDQVPGSYPAEDASNTVPDILRTGGYLPRIPVAPSGTTNAGYKYDQLTSTTYCLGVYLEGTGPIPGNDTPCDPDGAGAFVAGDARLYSVTQ